MSCSMTAFDLSLPRTPVPANLSLTQGATQSGQIFVMERVPHHDGPETVLELLNRPEGFFAFRPAANHDVLLISKVQTVSLSVDRQAPIADPARLSAAKMLGVELVLTGGSKLGGWASAELPEHHARLLDYLNASRDPFFAVLLREQGDQLYLLPDEPVTMVKDGKPRKVSRQPLTDQHIYALLVEVAPSESADHIDKMTETEFEYIADRGMVRVRIVPDMGRLTAMVARVENSAATQSPATGPAP